MDIVNVIVLANDESNHLFVPNTILKPNFAVAIDNFNVFEIHLLYNLFIYFVKCFEQVGEIK